MRTLKTLLTAGMLLGVPAVAHAQWYVGLDAGANFREDTNSWGTFFIDGVRDPVPHGGNMVEGRFDWGYVGLGQVGYNFGGPKVEFEVGWRKNDVSDLQLERVGKGSGDATTWSFMLNGIYEFMPNSAFHPFIGAGLGLAHNDFDATTVNDGVRADLSGSDWRFAYQGIAGASYDLTPNWAVKAQYRYFATLDHGAEGSTNVRNVVLRGTEIDNVNHSVLVGFTYKFAPTKRAMVRDESVQTVFGKSYMVFFDFNKANISQQAAGTIAQAADAAKKGETSRIALTGHTDRVGSDKYNQALSLKRGNAVKAELVRLGIPADQIAVTGRGKSEPLVATADGVREPQNRRVEILLP